jgi:hypothetical protein
MLASQKHTSKFVEIIEKSNSGWGIRPKLNKIGCLLFEHKSNRQVFGTL